MSQNKPCHKYNLVLKDLGDEFLIYSTERKEIHVINPTARLIWNLCDGNHSLGDIENEIRMHFSIPPERDVMNDIQSTLKTFQEKDLLEDAF